MGLRCLFAHDFGPTEVERERQEDGNEMVVTVREVQSCDRCGERKVLSENKEVTAIRTPEELGIDRPGGTDGRSTTAGAQAEEPGASPTGATSASPAPSGMAATDRESRPAVDPEVDDGVDERGSATPEGSGSTDDTPPSGPSDDPTAEDTEILDGSDAERGYGEWPDSGTDTAAASDPSEPTAPTDVDRSGADTDSATEEPTGVLDGSHDPEDDADEVDPEALAAEEDAEFIGGPSTTADERGANAGGGPDDDTTESVTDSNDAGGGWPAHDGDDEGFSAGAATDEGPGVSFGGGLTPQVGGERDGASANGETLSASTGYETSFVEAEHESRDGDGDILSAPGADEGATPAGDVETEFFCPSCGHTRPTDASLRPGDICPECQRGYIAERER